jgi:hypothetical protein
VAASAAALERKQPQRREEVAVEEREGVVRNIRPHFCSHQLLGSPVRPEARGSDQVRAHGHETDDARERIGARATTVRMPEVLAVLRSVRHTQERAVDCVDSEAAPREPAGALVRPLSTGVRKEPSHRFVTEPRSCLRYRTPRDEAVAHVRESKIEFVDDLDDRSVSEKRHPEHEPDHLLGGKPATAQRRRPGRRKRLVDPLPRQMGNDCRKALRLRAVGDRVDRSGGLHTDLLEEIAAS